MCGDMTDDESNLNKLEEGAKTILGCGLQAIAIWVGVLIVFALIFGVGLWLFDVVTS